jgi:hypothetical protein
MEYNELRLAVGQLCQQHHLTFLDSDNIQKFFTWKYSNSTEYRNYLTDITFKNNILIGDLFMVQLKKLLRKKISEFCQKKFDCSSVTETMIKINHYNDRIDATIDLCFGDSVLFTIKKSKSLVCFQLKCTIDDFFTTGWQKISLELDK